MFLEYTLQENPSRGDLNSDNLGVCPTGDSESGVYPIEEGGRQKEAGVDIPKKMPIVELIKLLVRARYEKYLPAEKRSIIIAAGQKYGLIDEQEQRTGKYFALLNDEVEQLARELTGQSKRPERPCRCGCGKPVKGKARYATTTCRKRVSRWDGPDTSSDVTVKPNSGLQAFDITEEKKGQNGG